MAGRGGGRGGGGIAARHQRRDGVSSVGGSAAMRGSAVGGEAGSGAGGRGESVGEGEGGFAMEMTSQQQQDGVEEDREGAAARI